MNIWTCEHMDIWTYGRGFMDIWAFRQMDIRMCCRDAGYENSYQDCSNKKKHGEFSGLFRFYSLETFCHIIRFI
jgi:hypothetical protein